MSDGTRTFFSFTSKRIGPAGTDADRLRVRVPLEKHLKSLFHRRWNGLQVQAEDTGTLLRKILNLRERILWLHVQGLHVVCVEEVGKSVEASKVLANDKGEQVQQHGAVFSAIVGEREVVGAGVVWVWVWGESASASASGKG